MRIVLEVKWSCTPNQRKVNYLFTTPHWQKDAQPLSVEQDLSICHGYLQTQISFLQMPSLPLPVPKPVSWNTTSCDLEYPFGQFKLAVLKLYLQPLWCWDCLPDIGTEWEKQINKQKNALMLRKHCSARARTAVCCQYCISHKSKTQHHSTTQTTKKKLHFSPDRFSRL